MRKKKKKLQSKKGMPIIAILVGATLLLGASYGFSFLSKPAIQKNFEAQSEAVTGPMKTVRDLVSTPDEKLDLGIASLTLAKQVWPNLDIEQYSKKIDLMVDQVRILVNGSSDPEYRVRSINTYLYKLVGITYDRSDPLASKPESRYINGILDSKKGTCLTMPLLYLTIAQRLGYPVKGVVAPTHFFLRYDDPHLKEQNIEATGGGGYSSNDQYKKDLKIFDSAIANGVYLRTLSNKEVLAMLISTAAGEWIHQIPENKTIPGEQLRLTKMAIDYLEEAKKLNPRDDMVLVNLGKGYQRLAYFVAKNAQSVTTFLDENSTNAILIGANMEAKGYTAKAESYFMAAQNLGINPYHFSTEGKKDYLAEVSQGNEKAENIQKQFKKEKPGLVGALRRDLNKKSEKLL